MTIKARMAFTASAAVAVAIIAAVTLAYLITAREIRAEQDRGLTRTAARMQQQIAARGWTATGPCDFTTSPCAQVLAPTGTVRPDGAGLPVSPRAQDVARGGHRPYFVTANGLRILTTPLAQGGALQVGTSTDSVQRSLDRTRWVLSISALGGVALAGLAGFAVASTSLRPVARLTAVAEQIAATGDPTHRIDLPAGSRVPRLPTGSRVPRLPAGDEISRLADSFNTMLAALEESTTAQRHLVADASHELRTPLTSLRSDVELLLTRADRLSADRRERLASRVRGQLAEMGGLVEDLIELARAPGDQPDDPVEDIRLDRLVEHCLDHARTHWPEVTFTADLRPMIAPLQPRRAARAIANLLDNAAKFTPPPEPEPAPATNAPAEGTPTESTPSATAPTDPSRAGGQRSQVGVTLTETGALVVRDHGPGIDPADLPRIFDRFYRAADARTLPGSGLGLAIVAQVAAAHQATITATPAPTGGTIFRLAFPRTHPS